MARKRILVNPLNPNGIEVAFTAEEEAQADTDAANAVTRRAAEAEYRRKHPTRGKQN